MPWSINYLQIIIFSYIYMLVIIEITVSHYRSMKKLQDIIQRIHMIPVSMSKQNCRRSNITRIHQCVTNLTAVAARINNRGIAV